MTVIFELHRISFSNIDISIAMAVMSVFVTGSFKVPE